MSEDQNDIHCPFWSTYALKCRLCYEGLFIPLDDHVEVFCTSPEYPLCLQYNMNTDDVPKVEEEQNDMVNRRTSPRIEKNYRVTLVKLTESGQLARHFSLHASTIDLSRGGMKLSTSEHLLDDTRIAFSFIDTFPKELQSGIAKIKWCKKQEATGDFLAGLAFENPPSEAIGMYLRLVQAAN